MTDPMLAAFDAATRKESVDFVAAFHGPCDGSCHDLGTSHCTRCESGEPARMCSECREAAP